MKIKNYLNLTKQAVTSIFLDKGLIVTGVVTLITNLLAVVITNLLFNDLDTGESWIYNMMLLLSVLVSFVLGTFCSLVVIKMFSTQIYEKNISLEKHCGYSNIQIYLSRVTAFIIALTLMLLIILIMNSIAYCFSIYDDINLKIFFLVIGWYLIFSLIIGSLTIIFCLYLKSTILVAITIIFNLLMLYSTVNYNSLFTKSIFVDNFTPRPFAPTIAQDYYNRSIRNIPNKNPKVKEIFDERDELLACFFLDGNFVHPYFEYLFMAGPGYWEYVQNVTDKEEYQILVYGKMADYFHEIFKKNTTFNPPFKNVTNFSKMDYTRRVDLKPFFKFLREYNTEYPELNEMMEIYWTNRFVKANNVSDLNYSIKKEYVEEFMTEIEKGYDNSGEFLFFHTLNKLIWYSKNWFRTGYDYFFEEMPAGLRNEFLLNAINPVGHLNLMLFCENYGKDWIYYEVLGADSVFPKKINVKFQNILNENGEVIDRIYSQPISVNLVYISYTLVVLFTTFVCYFTFRRKISK